MDKIKWKIYVIINSRLLDLKIKKIINVLSPLL